MKHPSELLRSPEYYPLRSDPASREVSFVRMSRETYRDSVFLDMRTRHLGSAYTLRLDDVILAASGINFKPLPVTYILHPAFCCSTLLSRYLELLDFCFVLREPLLLTQVALSSSDPTPQWEELFDCSIKLLTRGYEDARWIVIKAHEPCNVLGRKLLEHDERATVIFLTTPQRQFVLSVLKSSERRTWIRSRVCEVLAQGVAGVDWEAVRPSALTDAQAAACMWTVNDGLRRRLFAVEQRERVLFLDSNQLIDDPQQTLRRITRTCKQHLDDKEIAGMVEHPAMKKYSKDISRAYDANSRRSEIAQLEDRFGSEVDAGIEWAARHSSPAAAVA